MMPAQETEREVSTAAIARPVGVTFASAFYAASGIYYLAFPIAVQDLSLLHVFLLGVFSIVTSYGLLRMARLGLWLGLLLFPPQIVMPLFTLLTFISNPGVLQQSVAFAFVGSLIVLIFFASLSFLALLDKRRSFSGL